MRTLVISFQPRTTVGVLQCQQVQENAIKINIFILFFLKYFFALLKSSSYLHVLIEPSLLLYYAFTRNATNELWTHKVNITINSKNRKKDREIYCQCSTEFEWHFNANLISNNVIIQLHPFHLVFLKISNKSVAKMVWIVCIINFRKWEVILSYYSCDFKQKMQPKLSM